MTPNRRWFILYHPCGGEVGFEDQGVQLVAEGGG